MSTTDLEVLTTLQNAINARKKLASTTYLASESELLEGFKSELAILDTIKDVTSVDTTLQDYVLSLRLAIKAVVEIKTAMLSGVSGESADFAAVVTANDIEEQILAAIHRRSS